jgi:predicted lipoprotein with Yx(FWY)xxD motif
MRKIETRRGRIAAATGLAVVLAALGFAAASTMANSSTATSASVSLRATKLGKVLVASNGHTLYLFRKDRNDKSACSASCAAYWPPLLVHGKPTGGTGVKASLLGTTKRSNGSLQVTYNKHPLYRFVLDTKAGQTNGEGSLKFGAAWYVLSASGAAIVKASTGSTTTPGMTTTTPPGYP